MKSLKQYIQEREMKRTGGMPESADFHNRSYHKHFEGYTEYREPDARGRLVLKRVYTGIYHKAQLPKGKLVTLKVAYCTLWLLASASLFFLATRLVPSNTLWYSAACQAVSLVSLCWMFWSLFNYVLAGREMTLGEYRYVNALKRSSRFSSLSLLAVTIAKLISLPFQSGSYLKEELLCILAGLLAAASCYAVYLRERLIVYDSYLSDKTVPKDGNEISP